MIRVITRYPSEVWTWDALGIDNQTDSWLHIEVSVLSGNCHVALSPFEDLLADCMKTILFHGTDPWRADRLI